MNLLKKLLPIALVLTAALARPAVAATMPTFTLIPISGMISGGPGQTIGWGYTITNTMDFLVVTSSEFDLIPNSQISIGTYTDFIGPSGPIVGPSPENPVGTQMFNAMTMSGVGSFHINSNATAGAMNIGQILITYDLFSRSPNDPNFKKLSRV